MEFDPIETCPYDKVHRIRRSRMQFHITTCSQNFPATKMMNCPFDARHKINQVEFEYHKSHCPARESVINYAIHDTITQAEQRILPIDVQPVGVPDEDWDEDANVKSYNPLQAIRDKPIVYSVIGLSKAKRKDHRMQERRRYNQIMENSGNQNSNPNDVQTNSLSMQSEQTISAREAIGNDNDADEQTYKPLRRPFGIRKKVNNVPQNKNQATVHSRPQDSKKSPLKVEKTSNVSSIHSAVLPKNEESPTLRKPKGCDSIFDKLSRTFEELVVNDEGHKKKTESLDEQINLLKKKPLEKKSKGT